MNEDIDEDDDMIREGERIKLPPTPAELEALEAEGIPDEEDLRLEQLEREQVSSCRPRRCTAKSRSIESNTQQRGDLGRRSS